MGRGRARMDAEQAGMISIGVWGCGEMGRTLARAAAATRLGRVRAVFDRDPARSRALAGEIGAEASHSEDALLSAAEIEAVIIALPPFLHREAVLQAAQAGVHIFLEKPMALGVEACREMNAAVLRAGVSLMVGHVLRYFEPFRTITGWAREGSLGSLLHAGIWRLERDYIRLAPWKGQRALSGGYLYEVGAHDLDWLRCLLGEPAGVLGRQYNCRPNQSKEWPSEHEIEDFVSVHLQFPGGAAADYLGGAGLAKAAYGFCLRFRRATVRSANAFDPQAVRVEWVARDVGQPPAGDGGHRPPASGEISTGLENPFEAEIRDWLFSLAHAGPVPIPGEDAIRTVALIEAAYESAS